MRSPFPRTTLWAVLLISVLTAFPLDAQEYTEKFSLSFLGSVLFFPEDNGLNSDSGPILPSIGISAAWPLVKALKLELSLDLYGTYYAYSYNLDRAVPAIPDNRSSFVIGSILGVQAQGAFPLSDKMQVRVYGGPAADLRICFVADGLEGNDKEDASEETDAISGYFWGKGRWFMPVTGAGMDFMITEKIRLGFDTRIWLPAYRLWTGESLSFIEGWRFGFGIRFSFI
ncbi:MAG: hypothetical protein LBR99_02170 [Treponema sp.]|jgi:hypothetical protein|nr:hypothetical protein [Treponema sp.]